MMQSLEISNFIKNTQVSRETIHSLKKFEKMIIERNKSLNLIGKSTIKTIWDRHFLDSAQVIDLIDKNYKILVDLGSGAGFPGLVLSIIAKDRKMPLKIKLIEKSPKKSKFLNTVLGNLHTNAEVINKNIFGEEKKIRGDVFVARAFKPLPRILQVMHSKIENWKKIIIFLGKTGKSELLEASKSWHIEYKQRMSITNKDSIILEIINLKKR
jgi:16S rRNA (guanine527-N7)-methyltransferase